MRPWFAFLFPIINTCYALLHLLVLMSVSKWNCGPVTNSQLVATITCATSAFWFLIAVGIFWQEISIRGLPMLFGVLGGGLTGLTLLAYMGLGLLGLPHSDCITGAICSSLAILGISGILSAILCGMYMLVRSNGLYDFCGNAQRQPYTESGHEGTFV